MDILFASAKLRRVCSSRKEAVRRYGPVGGKRLMQRLDDLRAADNLELLRHLPQARCHELTGNLRGLLSVDLHHPYRLLLRPANEPVPRNPDGGLDWARVTAVEIVKVEDTHG